MKIKDLQVDCITRFDDKRGFFEVLYNGKILPEIKQTNCSFSVQNVLRGIHVTPFAKMVHCVKGKILDVVVDMRIDSSTYLEHETIELSDNNLKLVYVPEHCGHAFLALEDSVVVYFQNALYDPRVERIINYADPKLKISWPKADYILSDKDKNAPFLE